MIQKGSQLRPHPESLATMPATMGFDAIHSALKGTGPKSKHGLQSFVTGGGKDWPCTAATSAAFSKKKRIEELEVTMMRCVVLLVAVVFRCVSLFCVVLCYVMLCSFVFRCVELS